MSRKTAETDDDVVRLAVLGALVRGMSFAYTARTAAVTIDKVREIADAAGWPDIDAVRAMHTELRNAPEARQPRRVAPPPRPAPPARTPAAVPDEVIGLPAPEPEQPSAAEVAKDVVDYFAEVDEVVDAITDEEIEQKLTTLLAGVHANPYGIGVDQAEAEYRGEVVQTGPTPEHREPLADYVARSAAAELLIEESALSPATDSPAPAPARPGKKTSATVPCEGCGRGVLKTYVMANGGIQRHGHCREGS